VPATSSPKKTAALLLQLTRFLQNTSKKALILRPLEPERENDHP
jgi:hypothetical protein